MSPQLSVLGTTVHLNFVPKIVFFYSSLLAVALLLSFSFIRLHRLDLGRLALVVAGSTRDINAQSKSIQKELSKQQKVTEIHDQNAGIVLKACPTVILVDQTKGTNTNDASNDHLSNLRHSDPLRSEPLWLALDGHQKVIKVHDGMHAIVDGGVDDSRGSMRVHGMPTA